MLHTDNVSVLIVMPRHDKIMGTKQFYNNFIDILGYFDR